MKKSKVFLNEKERTAAKYTAVLGSKGYFFSSEMGSSTDPMGVLG